MTKRHATKAAASIFLKVAVAFICLVFAIVIVAFAGITYANGFGFSEEVSVREDRVVADQFTFNEEKTTETSDLKSTSKRDVSSLVTEIRTEEEAKAKAEAEAKKKHEDECIARAKANKEKAGNPDDGVDFAIGKDAFVQTWGKRIDKYLEGSPLHGQGKTFAEAAFENGIDPRVSPAISNTESSKGAVCFRPHNAWGWMGSAGWSNWEEAINAHIKGYADGYGYTVSEANAKKYCPPTWESWLSKTKAQMAKI